MNYLRVSSVLLAACITFAGCKDQPEKDKPQDTVTSGTIDISVDESYKPIIDEQIKVFDSSYPEANINPHYKPEAECFKDFMNGDTRFILVTRELSEDEKKVLLDNKRVPTSLSIAKDAVAIIVNNAATDTVFSIAELQGILTGEHRKKYDVVFDNQGSSTLRYMLDSIIPGQQLANNVYATKGNDSVISYVANNPNAIGFIGVSHVSDFSDPEGLAFINNVKVAWVYNDSLEKPYKPYQSWIAAEYYPLTRKLFYIHSETYQGLGTGFANFLRKDRGQLIFKQSRLFPTRVNIIFREAEVNP